MTGEIFFTNSITEMRMKRFKWCNREKTAKMAPYKYMKKKITQDGKKNNEI